jgi:hypothetical protein
MRSLKAVILCVATIVGVLAQPASAAQITPFSITQGALTVGFSSAPDPNGFLVSDAIPFVTLQGGTLIELFASDNALTLTFSQAVNAVDFAFALSTSSSGNLDYQAFSGGSLVDSGSVLATPPGFGFAEGNVLEVFPTFDTLVLTSTDASAFAIDNLIVATANPAALFFFTFDVPEPLSLTLFGAGLVGAGVLRRRRRVSAAL